MEKTFTCWVSNAGDLNELMELGNDLLRYTNMPWDDCMDLFRMSLVRGFTCIMVCEDDNSEEAEDAETQSGEKL